MSKVIDRFLEYVKTDTQSEENSECFPSTQKQKILGQKLAKELDKIGCQNVYFDKDNGYVYGIIPANDGGKCKETLGFISHMDTSPEISGANVNPQIVENYDGKDIILDKENSVVLSPKKFPELLLYLGKTLITADGKTLLGADDKAGIAEIVTMAEYLFEHSEIIHGKIALAFTPDEEVGGGIDKFDLRRFGADYAYTVDGGAIGELEYENFNAASAKIEIHGVNVHTGEAKNKMINATMVGIEFDRSLPQNERPELTEGYEGFFHLENFSGEVETAQLFYLIRDHDKQKFEDKKKLMEEIAGRLNEKYGAKTVHAEIKDTYYNMREKIEPDYMFLIERAKNSMEKLDINVKIQAIRGGTDGSKLSYMGLPCPNLCTGGHNFHGRYEYCCVQSMETIVKLLVEIASSGAENKIKDGVNR